MHNAVGVVPEDIVEHGVGGQHDTPFAPIEACGRESLLSHLILDVTHYLNLRQLLGIPYSNVADLRNRQDLMLFVMEC